MTKAASGLAGSGAALDGGHYPGEQVGATKDEHAAGKETQAFTIL
jgi:hypothetical protein